MSSRLGKRQIALFVYLAATTLILAGADFVYFDGAQQSASEGARAATSNGGENSAQCRLNPSKSAVPDNGASLINFQDITKGSGESGVTVVEYFDPNCPHCKDFHQVMKKLVAAHSESVRFVYKPFPLRRSSLPEIQALYVAAQSNKFGQMLDAQYARQSRGGINSSDLRAIASEIGMDPDVLMGRIEQGEFQQQVLKMRKRAVSIGVDSTPTVLINGHFVQTRTPECLNTFIEQAKEGTLGSTASK
jgi:protein-disulfide isomerase